MRPSLAELIERALAFHTLSIADLVAIFEDARPAAAAQRQEAMGLLARHPGRRRGLLVGVTGAPGAGKSTLIGLVGLALSARGLSVGVLAVDPSSQASGGALLGDRVRVRFPVDQPQLYFRSQASESLLGGLGPHSFQVCRLLHHLFDVVLVETVGVGQSEIDVRWLADRLYLVLQPLAGDDVQALKAGVMEVPDVIVINKCDEARPARRLAASLAVALPLARPFGEAPLLLQTSTVTGEGLDALVEDLYTHRDRAVELGGKEGHFFARWVKDEWGRAGLRKLEGELGGVAAFLSQAGGFDEAEARFEAAMRGAR